MPDNQVPASAQQIEGLGVTLDALVDRIEAHDDRVSGLVQDTVRGVVEAMPNAVAEALFKVLTDPQRMGAVVDCIAAISQQRAAAAAKESLWNVVKGGWKHFVIITVIGIAAAKYLTADAAAALGKFLGSIAR